MSARSSVKRAAAASTCPLSWTAESPMDAVGGSVYPADGDSTQKQAALQKAFRRAINDAQASGVIVIRDIGHLTWTWLASGQAERDICQEKPRRNTWPPGHRYQAADGRPDRTDTRVCRTNRTCRTNVRVCPVCTALDAVPSAWVGWSLKEGPRSRRASAPDAPVMPQFISGIWRAIREGHSCSGCSISGPTSSIGF